MKIRYEDVQRKKNGAMVTKKSMEMPLLESVDEVWKKLQILARQDL